MNISSTRHPIDKIMAHRPINTLWIYPHAIVNITGILVLFLPELYSLWLSLIGISFAILVWDIKRSMKALEFRPFGLGYPNLITTGRLTALLWFAYFFQDYSNLILFIAFTLIIFLDGLDGFVARRISQCSSHGEQLDAETDAQLVWLLSWIHFYSGNVDWWILIPGSLRYVYQLLFFWVPSIPNFPPKRFRATIAVIFFMSLSTAFILPEPIATNLLFVSSCLITVSFGLSLYGGLKAKSKDNLT